MHTMARDWIILCVICQPRLRAGFGFSAATGILTGSSWRACQANCCAAPLTHSDAPSHSVCCYVSFDALQAITNARALFVGYIASVPLYCAHIKKFCLPSNSAKYIFSNLVRVRAPLVPTHHIDPHLTTGSLLSVIVVHLLSKSYYRRIK